MEPTFTCPPGHRLDNKMCVIPPTMSCPTGHELINGMCQQIADISMSPLPEIPMSPELNMMTMSSPMTESPSPSPAPPESPVPKSPIMGSNCPIGYQFSSVDNMCYPLKI